MKSSTHPVALDPRRDLPETDPACSSCLADKANGRSEINLKSFKRSANTKNGQAFFREMAKVLDEMKHKKLISGRLINSRGECCALGAVLKSRKTDRCVKNEDHQISIAKTLKIPLAIVKEIEYQNDRFFYEWETKVKTWERMRVWVQLQIKD